MAKSVVLRRSVGRGAGYLATQTTTAFGRQAAVTLIQVILFVLLARVLGPAGNGIYAAAMVLPALLALGLNLGLPAANIYFLARGVVSDRQALRTNIIAWALLTVMGLAASLPLLFLYGPVAFRGVPRDVLWFAWSLFPILLLQNLLASMRLAYMDFRYYNLVMIGTALFGLGAAALAVLTFGWGVRGAVGAAAASQLLGTVLFARRVFDKRQDLSGYEEPRLYLRRSISYAWKAHLGNLLNFASYRADILLVTYFLGPGQAGIYVIAVQLAERIWMIGTSSATVLFPYLSSLQQDEETRRSITPAASRWAFYGGLAAGALLAAIGKPLIEILFGASYGAAFGALLLLLPGVILFNGIRVIGSDLAARGRTDLNLWTAALTLAVNLAGNVILIPALGIGGAAISSSISYGVTTALCLAFYSRLSDVRWWSIFLFERSDRARAARIFSRITTGS